METFFKPEPREPVTPSPDDSPKPVEHKPKKEHEIKVDLTCTVRA